VFIIKHEFVYLSKREVFREPPKIYTGMFIHIFIENVDGYRLAINNGNAYLFDYQFAQKGGNVES
jgi:hypothetical protein